MKHEIMPVPFGEGRAEELFRRIQNEKEAMIDELIKTKKSEELFLDFKRSADEGAGDKLHQDDRENLAKAISGFANSEGGIIIWGVGCNQKGPQGDVADSKYLIKNIKRFVSWLEGAISSCTLPPHSGVRSAPIEIDNSNEGFAVTYIPKSVYAPHQSILGKHNYYMRVGSSFTPVPHAILAGMFGRRPLPRIDIRCSPLQPATRHKEDATGDYFIRATFRPYLVNMGHAIARDAYLNIAITQPGVKTTIDPAMMGGDFEMNTEDNRQFFLMTKDPFRMAPSSICGPISFTYKFLPPFDSPLKIDLLFGCEGGIPGVKQIFVAPEKLQDAFEAFAVKNVIDGYAFAKAVFQGDYGHDIYC